MVGTGDVLDNVAQVIRQPLSFDEVDSFNATLRVVRWVIDHIYYALTASYCMYQLMHAILRNLLIQLV